jgi:hypothetical protein
VFIEVKLIDISTDDGKKIHKGMSLDYPEELVKREFGSWMKERGFEHKVMTSFTECFILETEKWREIEAGHDFVFVKVKEKMCLSR